MLLRDLCIFSYCALSSRMCTAYIVGGHKNCLGSFSQYSGQLNIYFLFYEEISKCDKIVIMITGKIYLFIEHIVFVKHIIKYRENVLYTSTQKQKFKRSTSSRVELILRNLFWFTSHPSISSNSQSSSGFLREMSHTSGKQCLKTNIQRVYGISF